MLYVELGAIFQVQSFMFHYSSKVIIEEITLFFQIKAFDGKTATICLFFGQLEAFFDDASSCQSERFNSDVGWKMHL